VTLRLFEHPLSPYARKVKLVLYEKGIPFDRVFVDPNVSGDDPVHQEFVLASPRREVPCLVDGDVRVAGSAVMLEYLEERWPVPASLPEGPAERARVRMLEELMDGEMEAVNWGLMEVRIFQRAEGERARVLEERADAQLRRLWGRLERELEGRPFANGARFGRGDAAVWPHLTGSALLGHPLPEASFPRLADWSARCHERPSVRKEAGEMQAAVRSQLAEGGMPRRPVRQYRDHRLEWMMKSGGVDVVLEGLEQGSIRFAHEVE